MKNDGNKPKGLAERLDYNADFKLDWHDKDEAHDGYQLKWVGKNYARLEAGTAPDTMIIPDGKHNAEEDSHRARNIFLTGDNLQALKHLQNCYRGAVKMIYIDPPYNTGSDGFVYQDKFEFSDEKLRAMLGLTDEEVKRLHIINGRSSHSAWLSFMYPRLKLARNLLSDDGVIFISIDDNEQANLKLLCDEIFGEANFLYQLSVVNSLNGNDNSAGMMETEEYCLIYARNADKFNMGVLPLEEEEIDDWEQDEVGYWKIGNNLKAAGIAAAREARPNLFFPIYINKKTLDWNLKSQSDADWYELLPLTNNKEMRWYWSRERFNKSEGDVIVKQVGDSYSLYKKQRPSLGELPSKRGKTTFYNANYSTSTATSEVTKLFDGNKLFAYPKSLALIKHILALANTGGGGRGFFAYYIGFFRRQRHDCPCGDGVKQRRWRQAAVDTLPA